SGFRKMQRGRPAAETVAAKNNNCAFFCPTRRILSGYRLHLPIPPLQVELLNGDSSPRDLALTDRQFEPVPVDNVAGCFDRPDNVVGCYFLAARLSADAGEHQDFRIGATGLRRGRPDEL